MQHGLELTAYGQSEIPSAFHTYTSGIISSSTHRFLVRPESVELVEGQLRHVGFCNSARVCNIVQDCVCHLAHT